MRTIETDLVVMPDGRARVLHVPPGVRGGTYHAILVIEDQPLTDTTKAKGRALRLSRYPVGVKDQDQTFRREDLYGDDGR
jgi:hypothetical protein